MGAKRLPRDPDGQRRWARRVAGQQVAPPIACFVYGRESRGQFFRRVFHRAYELGAEAALREILVELERSDDPLAGLPPHLKKSAQAAARARRRKAQRRAA